MAALTSKPGLTGASALSIPKQWDPNWYRDQINNLLKGADVRNAIGKNGVVITGNISTPYATVALGGTSPIILTNNITLNPTSGVALTINAASGTNGLIVNGAPNQFAGEFIGNITSGQSDGLAVVAGTTAADVSFVVQNSGGGATFFKIVGNGSGFIQPGGNPGLSWTNVGVFNFANSLLGNAAASNLGYAAGAGGAVTQITSRATGVTLNKICGAITLFTAVGTTAVNSFLVTNSTVAATDVVIVSVKSASNLYETFVTQVNAGSFQITFFTTGGTVSDAPVFNFAVIKAAAS